MKKQEFLDSLRATLSNRVGTGTVAENVNYYEDYINTQIRMGKSEDEVVDSLGDPRLLARSIAEANKHAGVSQSQNEYENTDSQYQSRDYQQSNQNQGTYATKKFRLTVWLILFIVFFFILIVCSLVFSVLSFLAPLLFPILLVIILVRMIRHT